MNYDAIAQLATRLIDANGRAITVIRFDQTAGDEDKPWKGPTDPREEPDAESEVYGVFVPPGGVSDLGLETVDQDLLKRTYEIAIVRPGTFDFSTANEILDNGVYKKVSFVKELRPGTVSLLYCIGISQ